MQLQDSIPQLNFEATNLPSSNFSAYTGKWLIIYFYPKDATPGCTTEGCDFRDNFAKFAAADAIIFGISRDSIASHEKFKAKQEYPFELISDSSEEICNAFDVIKMKNMYGKQVRGIERSTFIFGPDGKLQHEWRKVKVPGHVEEVLDTLQKLQQA